MSATALAHRAPVPMPLVWRFAASGLISAFAALLVFPYAVVELTERGHSAAKVGLFALLQPATMLLLIPLLPRLQRRFGRVAAVRLGLAAGALAAMGFALTDSYWLWCALAVLVGVQLAVHWTSVDTVISENVPKDRAGAIIGLYQTLLAAAVAGGPAVAAVSGVSFDTAAGAALALFAVAALPLHGRLAAAIDGGVTAPGGVCGGLGGFLRANKALAAAALLAGLFEVGTSAMGSVHALHLSFAAALAVLVASVIATGSLVAQFPIGWLADRFSVAVMMRLCGAVLLASALALPLAAQAPALLWLLAAIWGAFGGALQTLVYMHIAKTKTGAEIQLGMLTMALGFTLGSLVGPGLGGLAAEAWPAHGLAAVLGLMAAALLALLTVKRGLA